MVSKEPILKHQSSGRIVTTIIICVITISSVILCIYALKQKKAAETLTELTKQKAAEFKQKQDEVVQSERLKADSILEQAMQQRELGMERAKQVNEQREINDSVTKKALENLNNALLQKQLAEDQKKIADNQKIMAEKNADDAKTQKENADNEIRIANEQKQNAGRLKQLADSKVLANESILLLNENKIDSAKKEALQAFLLNKINNGPHQSNDIYTALHFNWVRSINYKNICSMHNSAVHCITGMPGNNIIFTADESGVINECLIKNSSLQKLSSYTLNEEARALCVSPNGKLLVAITAKGTGYIFSLSSSNISFVEGFNFSGTGKAVAFNNESEFIVLSSQGIGKYNAGSITGSTFLNREGINAFLPAKNGKIYVALGNQIKIYSNWDGVVNNSSEATVQCDAKVTSIAADDDNKYLAAGTANGFIKIIGLKNNDILWNRALHISSVNDMKFLTTDDKLQLATAGADQLIKLIDVKAAIENNIYEDVISMKGHTKWIYALYYTPDGKWLLSAGEDHRVIAWKPGMNELYQALQ